MFVSLKKNHFYPSILFLSSLFVFLFLGGCTSPYTQVRQKDTLSAYKQFLKDYPNSTYKKSAERRIEELHYQRAIEDNSADSYNRYSFVDIYRFFYQHICRCNICTSLQFENSNRRGSMAVGWRSACDIDFNLFLFYEQSQILDR